MRVGRLLLIIIQLCFILAPSVSYGYQKEAVKFIQAPYNSNDRSIYIELSIFVENEIFRDERNDVQKVQEYCMQLAHIVNHFFMELNTFVALVAVDRMPARYSATEDAAYDLNQFSELIKEKDSRRNREDIAILLTKSKSGGNGVVGKAFIGGVCVRGKSVGVVRKHSDRVFDVALTLVHELGHILGMNHDEDRCRCACIMDPTHSVPSTVKWSPCSRKSAAEIFSSEKVACLRNKPRKLFGSPSCGNGFVEPGEQCDCGLPDRCDNPCCDPHTCMLHPNATCATGRCCNLQSCKVKRAGRECRTSKGECDLSEFCSGTSEYCPQNDYQRNGMPCKGGDAYCYDGQCSSHEDACRALWGPTARKGDNYCYNHFNQLGDESGHCGLLPHSSEPAAYSKCRDKDASCGLLQCEGNANQFQLTKFDSFTIHTPYREGYGYTMCRHAVRRLAELIDFPPLEMVPNGAKCGRDMMCVDQQCIPAINLDKKCKDGCNGNGICNSRGVCNCRKGSPPYCKIPPQVDTETEDPLYVEDHDERIHPVDADSDGSLSRVFQIVFFVVFFGVIPIAILVLLGYFYWRGNAGSPAITLSRLDNEATGFSDDVCNRKVIQGTWEVLRKYASRCNSATEDKVQIQKYEISKPVLEFSTRLPPEELIATRLEQLDDNASIYATIEVEVPI